MKEIELAPLDSNLLVYIQNHQQAVFSGVLSTIVANTGYTVTDKTRFEISADYTKIKVSEIEAESPVKVSKNASQKK